MTEDEKKNKGVTEPLPPFHESVADRRINCFALLLDLEHHGKSNARVAADIGVPRSNLRRWKAGAEPGYSDGCRLIEYHTRVCLLGGDPIRDANWPIPASDL